MKEDRQRTRASRASRAAAWGAHLLTASGAVWGTLALLAAAEDRFVACFAWLAVALIVDSFDGMVARGADVRRVLPGFDGELLDNLVDFLNYAVVPAVVLVRAGLLPRGFGIAGVAVVVLASGYQFCQRQAKTDDHFFLGFPSYWNVAVFYMFVGGSPPPINLAVLAALTVLVFWPQKWIYPSRMRRFRGVTVVVTVAWGASCIALLALYPTAPGWFLVASLLYVPYYIGLSLYLSP